jgi:hypothetical protein
VNVMLGRDVQGRSEQLAVNAQIGQPTFGSDLLQRVFVVIAQSGQMTQYERIELGEKLSIEDMAPVG